MSSADTPLIDSTTAASQPPIVYFYEATVRLLSIAATSLVFAWGYVSAFLKVVLTPVISLLDALSSPIRYLIAPLFLLINLLLSTPKKTAETHQRSTKSFASSEYPLGILGLGPCTIAVSCAKTLLYISGG